MTNSVVLYFTPRQHPDIDIPYSLRGHYAKDVWEKRIPAFTRKASRYYHQLFEWAWFIVFVCAMIGVPIGIYRVAWNSLPEDQNEGKDDHWWRHHGFDRVWKARLISFASWFAVTLLCYIPMIAWKLHGKSVVNEMLKKWEKEDKALGPNRNVPSWRMRTPGFLSNTIKLVIHFSSDVPPSSFHPAASLPSYLVNGPADPNAAYYYQPPMGGHPALPLSASNYASYHLSPGQIPPPPTTGITGVPLFTDRDEKADGYVPPLDPNADPEKQQFENVRM